MNKLLVVVDYQNDFVNGALGFAGATALEAGIAELVESYLSAGDRVIFTLDTHQAGYLDTREGKALPVTHCIENSEGWRLYGKLGQYMDSDRVALLPKVCFGSLGYSKLLDQAPEEITLVGVVTNMCVISNAVTLQTLYPQAAIVIRAGLCASFDNELHDKALDVMRSMQITVC